MLRRRADEARARADAALLRASRAGLAAEIQEERARVAPEELREIHAGLASFHRQAQARHETSAMLQSAYADRLEDWEASHEPVKATVPSILTGLAGLSGTECAIVLHSSDGVPALISASGGRALRAVELEYVMGEGPIHDCLGRHQEVVAESAAEVWPAYALAAGALGVRSVAASPLAVAGRQFGVLAMFNRPGDDLSDRTPLPDVAAALADVLLALPPPGPDLVGWEVVLSSGSDIAALMHRASGQVAEHRGCQPGQALSMIGSRALATGEDIESVARGVLRPGGAGDLRG